MGNRNCPVCGKNQSVLIKRLDMKVPEEYHLPDHYFVVACEHCGMVYADTTASMEDYNWYYSHCNFHCDDSKDDNLIRYKATEEFLEKFYRKDSVLLNIGIGNGRFEADLKKNGYINITGMDLSLESVEKLKEIGFEAFEGNIYSDVPQSEKNKYDGIFLFEVAEHLLLPEQGIAHVKEMLKPDGIFMLSVPEYTQLGKETKIAYQNYFNREHINYFSDISLDNLMGRYGMQRIAHKIIRDNLIHCYKNGDTPRKMQKDTITQNSVREYFAAQQEKEEEAAQIISELAESQKEVVIWGTGSYVMSLIATTNMLECNIKGMIDNNKLKQGREIYGHTIYAPEFLKDKAYTVLICSMLNSKDIQVQLESMHTKNDYIIL